MKRGRRLEDLVHLDWSRIPIKNSGPDFGQDLLEAELQIQPGEAIRLDIANSCLVLCPPLTIGQPLDLDQRVTSGQAARPGVSVDQWIDQRGISKTASRPVTLGGISQCSPLVSTPNVARLVDSLQQSAGLGTASSNTVTSNAINPPHLPSSLGEITRVNTLQSQGLTPFNHKG
ncbi:hypothetical protein RRG08_010371 [Elysia crispata]|uniref:Uncharacterized protein n=1 Tax=Elysia crispata TaxID=231223 RepID=A0AAE1BB79_9GAST|nr:hypothetical protein RRG08_010371 [Elysia crispata]